MRRIAIFLLAAVGIALGDASFDEYLLKFGKSYADTEYAYRQALFEERRAQAEEQNAMPDALWRAGVNEMWDMTPSELRQRLGYNKRLRDAGVPQASLLQAAPVPHRQLPAAVDWRNHTPPILTPVKNQGGCGSCWAFAAVQSVEASVALNTGVLLDLSPQQLNSCVRNPDQCGGAGGCLGATPQLGFNYTMQVGISDVWQAPYVSGTTGRSGKCVDDSTSPVAGITGYKGVRPNSGAALLEAVALHGPISVSVDASDWWSYYSGIFDSCNKTSVDINHAVQLVGYGEERGVKYWIVRNSWGPFWGENGFIRLRRHDQEPCAWDTQPQDGFGCQGGPERVWTCGECGILADAVYAVGGYLSNTRRGRRLEAASGPTSPGSVPTLV